MKQLIFQFPFKTSYYEKDFYVSSNNFNAFKLIEGWPNWPGKNINIYGPKGCGKTHLANIFKKKIDSIYIEAAELENISSDIFKNKKKCLIIDNYKENIKENFFYTIINEANQNNQYIVVNSLKPLRKNNTKLKDLKSRFDTFIDLGIDLPTDDLLRVILTKSFSDKQIKVSVKLLEYIIKNIERSYEKTFKFIKDIDAVSLSSGKSININLIKLVLKNE